MKEKHLQPTYQEKKLTIANWAEEDRPRERLRDNGAESLSKAELLAILIGSGTTKQSAVELMKDILHDCDDNLNKLGKMSLHELMHYNGIGEAKAITILAACELAKRRSREQAEERLQLDSADHIYDYMHTHMQDLDVEEAWVLLMNQQFRLIKAHRLSHGGISETAVDVRLALKEAILNNATVMVLCHNHPSGGTTPSAEDNELTEKFRRACETMRVYFLDHIIVTDGDYYSYRENNKL